MEPKLWTRNFRNKKTYHILIALATVSVSPHFNLDFFPFGFIVFVRTASGVWSLYTFCRRNILDVMNVDIVDMYVIMSLHKIYYFRGPVNFRNLLRAPNEHRKFLRRDDEESVWTLDRRLTSCQAQPIAQCTHKCVRISCDWSTPCDIRTNSLCD